MGGMSRYIIRRLLQVVFTVLLITILLFILLNLMRGNAIDIYFGMSEDRTPASVAYLKAQYGLDKPLITQYLLWLGKAVRLDLGTSWYYNKPVMALFLQRIQLSLELVFIASVISMVGSLVLGVYLAVHQNSIADQVLRFVGLIFLSAPLYWIALAIIVGLSRTVHWIPPIRYVSLAQDWKTHLVIIALPSTLWGLTSIPSFSRYVRNAVLDVLSSDFVRTARAKGLRSNQVLFGHAMRNAAGPLATVVGLSFAGAAGGSVLLETVFSLPGMGRLYLSAIGQRDYPVVMGLTLLIAVFFLLVILITDLSYAFFDPRIRYE
jgi:peptide/nickel transport system permease protein